MYASSPTARAGHGDNVSLFRTGPGREPDNRLMKNVMLFRVAQGGYEAKPSGRSSQPLVEGKAVC